MMDQDRITQYIHSLDQGHGAFCDQIAKTARTGRVPIIRKETANFLQAMVAAKQPKRILEVGTAVGYSALLMAQVMPEGTDIITIEKYEPRIPVARRHFEEAGLSDRITLLEGDAGEILKELDGSFDFIFMDAAKGQYIHCRIFSGCYPQEAYCFPTMCCRTETLLNPALRWSAATVPFTRECGSICTP